MHSAIFALRAAATVVASCVLMAHAQAGDDLTQPIRASRDGHFLTQPDGAPFFWLGDAALQLFKHLNRDETDRYLRDRAQKGFTVIQAVVLGFYKSVNRDGEVPLIDNDPMRPNARYFEHVDWVVDRAAHYGLRIAMLPTWGDHVTGSYAGGPKVFNAANAEVYGRWIATRYRGKGVIWVLGGDTNPLWPQGNQTNQFGEKNQNTESAKTIIDYRPVYDALAKGIMEGEGGDPFITYHPTSLSFSGTAPPRTSLYLGTRAWLDMNMLQTGHFRVPILQALPQLTEINFSWRGSFNYQPIAEEFNSSPTRPVIDGETRWEDLPVNQQRGSKDYWTAYDNRNAAYQAVFAGAAGHNYGNENVANFYDPTVRPGQEMEWRPWQEAIQSPVASQLQYLKALMLSRPYFTRLPDPSIVVSDAGEGEKRIGATRDQDGKYLMIYLPQGQAVTADLSRIAGRRAVGWWFNPRTGTATRIKQSFATKDPKRFTPPSGGPELDWVLVIDDESQSFTAPGAKPSEESKAS